MDKLLFVYGTLMQGMRNHVYLEKATLVGPAETKPEYELLYNGSIPAMRPGSESVKGELYEVNDEILAGLDVVEDVAANLYERHEIEVGGKTAIAYLGGNIFNQDSWEHVPNGDYRALMEAK
ncbi:MAG: gamma-glutamylcyclotransferase [Candidatus Yanofskybacteria bacterium]|nr:gamma-glutamylcyclotransferase [Candidatus Yanofskybacteria bacterium]